VREVLLDTLKHDTNPGVRVEAVNLLVSSLEKPEEAGPAIEITTVAPPQDGSAVVAPVAPEASDASLAIIIRELEILQHSDPSRYVRLRSAAALRQLSARNDQ
jgi:hypothetical protein